MSATATTETISRNLQKARTQLDRMRVKGELLKLQARDKKDEVLRDLEDAYAKAASRVRDLQDAAHKEATAVGSAARDAWEAFRTRYKEATGEELDG